jgi:hypothetical protein
LHLGVPLRRTLLNLSYLLCYLLSYLLHITCLHRLKVLYKLWYRLVQHRELVLALALVQACRHLASVRLVRRLLEDRMRPHGVVREARTQRYGILQDNLSQVE